MNERVLQFDFFSLREQRIEDRQIFERIRMGRRKGKEAERR